MATAGLILGIAGSVVSAVGAIGSGIAQKKAADFQASQLEQQARAEKARGSRAAAEESRQRRLKLSRAQAVGASSGAGRAYDVEGDIEEEGRLRALTAVWEGEERATGRRNQAAGVRAGGKASMTAGMIGGASTLFSGVGGSLLKKYG